jgi:Na+-driven multidrug efflux pump
MAEVGRWYMQGIWLAGLLGLLGVFVLLNTRNILVLVGQDPLLAGIA